jgi:DNA-directed RNA polymerase subunit RPC12/RpoP
MDAEEEVRERRRYYSIKYKYGLSKEDYDELLASTGGDCVICTRNFTPNNPPVVDHDHKTGEIRGIICRYCNHRVVGRHRDPDLLLRVSEYLRPPHTGHIVPARKKTRRRKKK